MYSSRLFAHGLLKKLRLTTFLLTATFLVHAQKAPHSITLDLANLDPTGTTTSKSPAVDRTIDTIFLNNAFPGRTYTLQLDVTFHLAPPLQFTPPEGVQPEVTTDPCSKLQALYNDARLYATEANTENTELVLKQKLNKLQDALDGATCEWWTKAAEKLIALCKRPIGLATPLHMQSPNDYSLTITSGSHIFKYLFEGKPRGQWVINYGFLFSSRALEPSRFYTQQLGADSFQIRKKRRPNTLDLRFAPTVFFSWFPNKNLAATWNSSLSLGVGFNMQSPVVSLGYNLMFNQNIGFSTGVVFYEQQKLNGRYQEGQIVKADLEESQLYETSFFRPNLFLALNVRLGQNPFRQTQ